MADKITIKNSAGKELEVFERAFEIYYSAQGFKRVDEHEKEPVDLSEMSESQLKRVNKEDLKAYLDEEEIEYDDDATKDDLIALILKEGDAE